MEIKIEYQWPLESCLQPSLIFSRSKAGFEPVHWFGSVSLIYKNIFFHLWAHYLWSVEKKGFLKKSIHILRIIFYVIFIRYIDSLDRNYTDPKYCFEQLCVTWKRAVWLASQSIFGNFLWNQYYTKNDNYQHYIRVRD